MADNSGIKFLKYYAQKLKSFFLSKDILSFLLFLAISSAFWFVHALGKERETSINVPIIYVGIPANIAITNTPPTEISLNVRDQGLHLLDYYSNNNTNPIVIDLKRVYKQKGQIVITTDQLNSKIKKYLKTSTTLIDTHLDSIVIQYEKLSAKKLPVKFNSGIELANQYMLSDTIQLNPNTVTVYGPKHMLDSLKFISTELLQKKNLNDTCSFRCNLKAIKLLRYSIERINVKIFIEAFTERKVQIPITIANCPDNLSIRTFPAFANATYTVGLSNFNSLSPSDIQVYLDYNDLKISKQSKQSLKYKNNTSHISNIRISPQEVEFILEQK